MWRNWNPNALLVGMQNGAALWKMVRQFLKKLNMKLPHDPAILILAIDPEELKAETQIFVHPRS